MDDISSRDDEKGRELAKEKGRQEEQDQQRQRDLATEKGRKQGQAEERSRGSGKSGMGTSVKIVLALVVIVIVVAAAAFLTLSVSVTKVSTGDALPFTTNYAVTIPEGQTIAIGNSQMSVLAYQNTLVSNIDGDQQQLVVGEDRIITERRAVITTLGMVTLVDTNFQINLKYKGDRDNQAYFDMGVHTSRQVPDILLRNLIPSMMHAQPI